MENTLMNVHSNAPAREIGVITNEIREIRRQAQSMALMYAIEIGRRLDEAKRALPYGEWGKWLKEEAEISQSNANNFMRLYEEYGAAQISIFGATVDNQTFANLPYSKALALLSVDKSEREAFAEEVGAEDLSVRELKKAIDERNEARKAAEEAKERVRILEERADEAKAAAAIAEEKAREATELRERAEALSKSLEESKENAKALKEKLEKAKKDPKIPPAVLEKLKAEAESAARKEIEAAANSELKEAKEKAAAASAGELAARLEAKQAQERLEEAEKKLKTASPEVTVFKTLFESIQETAKKIKSSLSKISEDDAELGAKLHKALEAFAEGLVK